MYHKSVTELSSLTAEAFKTFLDSFDTVLTDCDGVLWLEMKALEGSPAVINTLQDLGKKIFYVTNNSTKLREDFEKKGKLLGFKCQLDQMVSTSYIAAEYLKAKGVQKAYVIGSTGISQELDKVGIENFGIGPDILNSELGKLVENYQPESNVKAVVVGFDPHISYVKLMKASSYLGDPECHFIATNTDESFPASQNLIIPGTGTFVSAVATCSGRDPTVMGKPHHFIVDAISKNYKINPARTLMIGDRCNTDIMLGSNCGFQTLLVLTGVHQLKDVKNFTETKQEGLVPDFYLPKLGDMLPLIQQVIN